MIIETLVLGVCMTNCYIISGNETGCVVIDPASDADIIFNIIKAKGLKLEAILLTHGHFDHISAIPALVKLAGNDIPVYVHSNDKQFLSNSSLNLSRSISGLDFMYKENINSLKDNDKLSLAGMNFFVLHTPGHTPGSVCYICDDCIFTGDTLFASTIGRTDFPGGNFADLISSLDKLKSLSKDYYLYPGHNAATTLSREIKYNEYMKL